MKSHGCNLECVDDPKGDDVVEFVGPVKIVLVDQPRNAYRNKTWAAAFITLAQMLMATTTIFVIFYTLSFSKREYLIALHVFLGTVGFQLVMPSGVLMVNVLTGASAPMSHDDRRFEHGLLQLFSLGLVTGGAIASYYAYNPKIYTIHGYIGGVATGLTAVNVALGMFIYVLTLITSSRYICLLIMFHRLIGIPTILASSACFISGLINVSFRQWVPSVEMFYFLLIFCIFYTIVIIYKPITNL